MTALHTFAKSTTLHRSRIARTAPCRGLLLRSHPCAAHQSRPGPGRNFLPLQSIPGPLLSVGPASSYFSAFEAQSGPANSAKLAPGQCQFQLFRLHCEPQYKVYCHICHMHMNSCTGIPVFILCLLVLYEGHSPIKI